jgi:glutamate-1-semialdehyde aminotransferase
MLDGIGARISARGVGDRVTVGGEPHRSVVSFVGDDALIDKSWVQQTLIERGVLFNGSMFISARHSDADVDRALDAMDEAFAAVEAGEDLRRLLKGPPVEPVFRNP